MHATRGQGRFPSKTHMCGKCTTRVADKSDAVQCSTCVNWFHLARSDVTEEVYPNLERIKGCICFCESCLQLVEYDLQQPGGKKPFIDSLRNVLIRLLKHLKSFFMMILSNYQKICQSVKRKLPNIKCKRRKKSLMNLFSRKKIRV